MEKVDVAVPIGIDRTFTYLCEQPIPVGCRVTVPFGERNRRVTGVVVGDNKGDQNDAIVYKSILEQVDRTPIYSTSLMKLARWMSEFYLCPIGDVLRTMLPASETKRHSSSVQLTASGLEARDDKSHDIAAILRAIWKKSESIDLKTCTKRLEQLAQKEGGSSVTLSWLLKQGYAKKEKTLTTRVREFHISQSIDPSLMTDGENIKELTPSQESVLSKICEGFELKPESLLPYLLHGVTGAGKTEIYLQLIGKILTAGPDGQVLVLVPEIALTPQMTRLFSARFPGYVAVVHSAMTPKERWSQLMSLRTKQCRILIGPRSAVFAPFAELRLIIVDEEHDPSYKQTTGMSYNARDVAVMRARIESSLVVLGSATPSLESYLNAQQGRYYLLELASRPFGRKMPSIKLLQPMGMQSFATKVPRQGSKPRTVELPVDPRIIEALRANFSKRLQSMVIVNRRGYAYFVFDLKERQALSCPHCSISLTVHKKSSLLRCHYCNFTQTLAEALRGGDPENFVLVGYGSEQVEAFLATAIPGAKISRVDSDTTSQKDEMPKILEKFGKGEIDILVGTQMLAKGHDFAKVSVICILELDQTLNLPDFRAGERTFQLMVQAAGRAGRDSWPGEVLIQTQRIEHPVLQAGMLQNYKLFWEEQQLFRRMHHYPPFSKMIVFEFTSKKVEYLDEFLKKVEAWLRNTLERYPSDLADLHILGPSIPPIEKIRGRVRRTILLMSINRKPLWAMAKLLKNMCTPLEKDLTLKIDVEPQSLI